MAATHPLARTPAPAVGPDRRLAAVKGVHTVIWFSIEACVLYLLATGLARRSGRGAAVAAGVVAGECAVFAANGFHCPLTRIAESMGAESGSVTDIYLPKWFARNLPAIHVPVLALIAFLHIRNLRTRST
jgi:hypothetical protein